MRIDFGPANHHIAISLYRVRFISRAMRDFLRKEGIWEDLIQELYAAGWNAYRQGLDDLETRRYSTRRVYAFLKAYGFRLRRRHYTKPEIPFTAAFQYNINDRGIAPRDEIQYIHTDHLDNEILDYIKQQPEGQTRRRISAKFAITVDEVNCYLARLKKKGLVVEYKKENARGPTPTSIFLDATQPLPEPMGTMGRDDSIRKAYFVDGWSIKRINRDMHHDKRTIHRAIYGIKIKKR